MKFFLILFSMTLLAISIIINGCSVNSETFNRENEITIFKSSNCGCCVGYSADLEKNGYRVKSVNTEDMSLIKKRYNISPNMESCHTAIIGDYFIEGHVPIEAVQKLLEEKPSIDGIALPRMPAGSPGMPGVKKAPFKIYALSNGQVSDFMTI
jgi:hypothetical protein